MQQQLETLAYESSRIQERKHIIYSVSDLERLSATALYYGDGSSSGSSSGSGGGFGGFGIVESAYKKGTKKGPSSGGPKPSLTIRNFPTMQLHIHEKDSLITGANIKGKGKEGDKFSLILNNYEAVMGDLYADLLNIKKK